MVSIPLTNTRIISSPGTVFVWSDGLFCILSITFYLFLSCVPHTHNSKELLVPQRGNQTSGSKYLCGVCPECVCHLHLEIWVCSSGVWFVSKDHFFGRKYIYWSLACLLKHICPSLVVWTTSVSVIQTVSKEFWNRQSSLRGGWAGCKKAWVWH